MCAKNLLPVAPMAGSTYKMERLSTVDFLVNIACFVKKILKTVFSHKKQLIRTSKYMEFN
jgi:hypothetical protein